MKRVASFLIVLMALGGFVYAQGTVQPYVTTGDLLVQGGIGYGGLAAGAEFELAQFQLGPIPLTVGAGARAAFDPLFGGYGTTWAIGGFGMAHISFQGLRLPSGFGFASNCDTYLGLGLGLAGISANDEYDIWTWKPGLGFSFILGESYYLNQKFALYAEYGYIGRYKYTYDYSWYTASGSWPVYYATFGVIFKL